jgi:hypothetical protein
MHAIVEIHRLRTRFRRVRRVSRAARLSLGLPLHVGVDDHDLERARYYRALEQLIAREAREADLKPLAQIGFDGRPAPKLVATLEHPDNEGLTDQQRRDLDGGYLAMRNTSSSPLDYFYFQSKAGIAWWEWIAGKRFEYDWHIASSGRALTQSLQSLMLARVPKMTRAERKDRRLRPRTFKPRGAKRVKASPTSISDSKLDAMARLGRLMDSVSNVSWWLLVEIVGKERTAKTVALQLGETPDYIGRRFRESLCEAAAHYRLGPSSRPRETT